MLICLIFLPVQIGCMAYLTVLIKSVRSKADNEASK
jgi:hypothetical protein